MHKRLPGAIFEQGTEDIQSAFKFAMLNHNSDLTNKKFELLASVDIIKTADVFKLSRLSKSCIIPIGFLPSTFCAFG
ncbi:UNVERIFIED_CONTAM: hypothetical protein PYX00_001933 [Menopon gallinae]|uniref:Uncharacterized protein n=1 Tax=Menopon gallinae TaxID=328185 RepID=A0AAW2IG05_9NEOP